MIIMPLHTPEIKMGETWQAPQDVPLNDLKLQGGKMMMEKDKTMKDDNGDADGDKIKEAKMCKDLVALEVELPEGGTEVPTIVFNVVNLEQNNY